MTRSSDKIFIGGNIKVEQLLKTPPDTNTYLSTCVPIFSLNFATNAKHIERQV